MLKKCLAVVFMLYSFAALAQQRQLDVLGHRGARGLMPENTIPAMKKALEVGATTLELDVCISKDRLPVVSHDPYFSADITLSPEGKTIPKSAERHYNIYRMPYGEIRKFDVGSKPHPDFPRQQKLVVHKPLLAELIDAVALYAANRSMPAPQYSIEIKASPDGDSVYHPAPVEFVALVMQVVEEKGIQNRVTIQSFDPRILEEIHRRHPYMRTSLLVSNLKGLEKNLQRLSFQPTMYSPYHKLVTRKTIEACHKKGIKIIPWTVNRKARINKLVRMGVDGIITDYPDLLQTPVHSSTGEH